MTRASRPFKEVSNELLKDHEYAAVYLEECLLTEDIELFKLALKHVADARFSNMAKLTKKTALSHQSLYKMLSEKGNMKLGTLKKNFINHVITALYYNSYRIKIFTMITC